MFVEKDSPDLLSPFANTTQLAAVGAVRPESNVDTAVESPPKNGVRRQEKRMGELEERPWSAKHGTSTTSERIDSN